MVTFGLIAFIFVLLGVIGFQLMYTFYVERMDRDRKKYVRELERQNLKLKSEINRLRLRPAGISPYGEDDDEAEVIDDDESWAEVLEEN